MVCGPLGLLSMDRRGVAGHAHTCPPRPAPPLVGRACPRTPQAVPSACTLPIPVREGVLDSVRADGRTVVRLT